MFPDPLRLMGFERRWAGQLFSAILGSEVDSTRFFDVFDRAPPPLVRAGLRPMLHALVFLPLFSGFGGPFFRLAPEDRARFLAAAEVSRSTFVRQSLVTLKTLACFAHFEDPAVRARFG